MRSQDSEAWFLSFHSLLKLSHASSFALSYAAGNLILASISVWKSCRPLLLNPRLPSPLWAPAGHLQYWGSREVSTSQVYLRASRIVSCLLRRGLPRGPKHCATSGSLLVIWMVVWKIFVEVDLSRNLKDQTRASWHITKTICRGSAERRITSEMRSCLRGEGCAAEPWQAL